MIRNLEPTSRDEIRMKKVHTERPLHKRKENPERISHQRKTIFPSKACFSETRKSAQVSFNQIFPIIVFPSFPTIPFA